MQHRRKGICEVAEDFDAKDEYVLQEGERALVFCLNSADCRTNIVEKQGGKLIFLTDTYQIDLDKYIKEADRRLIEKMKAVIEFEQLEALGIFEDDEKNKKAFEDFYGSVERVKRELAQNEEAIVLFENLWLLKSEVMSREEYRECMLPFYEVCVEIVQELMAECSMDRVSKIYLSGDRSNDISLWEYLEGRYHAEVCILPKNYD
ncbi:MAG: hypothetical protein ACI4AD_01955 [Roseburia sp.]